MKLRLPYKGVADILPDSLQPQDTTRDMLNMRGEDCVTKKLRLSPRPGLAKYIANQLPGPIRALKSVTYQRKNVTYTDKVSSASVPLGTADASHMALTASASPVQCNHTDKQGNLYSTDGPAGIEKRNSALERQWKIALSVDQDTAVVRALRVATIPIPGADSEMVFCAVSEGGLQKDAKVWGYKQISTRDEEGKVETKTELVFELKPLAYTEVIRIRDGLMYCAQNEHDRGRSYVRVYFGLVDPAPLLVREFEIPYPVNGMDVRASDGCICTAHPPNAKRGLDPTLRDFTARDLAQEWTIDDLVAKTERLWTDFNAETLKALGIEDGAPVTAWPDDGPGFRSLFAVAGLTNQPTFVLNGIGGKPAVRFSGKTAGTAQRLHSQTNAAYQPQYADQQKTIVPGFTGCRWAMFIVLRCNSDTAFISDIFAQDNQSPAGSNPNDARLVANVGAFDEDPSVPLYALGPALGEGKILWDVTTVDATGEGMGLGAGGGTRSIPFSGDMTYSKSTGTTIVTIVSDGRSNAGTDAAQHSMFRVNGRPIDRWLSANQANIAASTIGGTLFGAGVDGYMQGDIARIIVVREYPDGGAHGDPITGALDGAGTSHYPRAIGTFGSAARAWAANTTNRYNDNEIERIEGWLAGVYGVSHILPCGTASVLACSVTPNAADTVTIAGVVYTFVAAATLAAAPTVANNVALGAGGVSTAIVAFHNLFHAINGTGEPGVHYGSLTVPHPTVRATSWNDQDGTAATAKIKVETMGLTPVTVSESTAGVRMTWTNATTSTQATVTTSAILAMPGHYPHPFSIHYGFPRKDQAAAVGVTLESKGKLLNSTQGILARWDANGKIAWVATSRLAVAQPGGFNLPATDQEFGAIGYDCMFGPEIKGDTNKYIFSTGPQYASTAGDKGSVLRRMIDNTTSVALTGTGTWTMGTTALVGAITEFSMPPSQRPRIDVDTFGNVYLPFWEPTPANNSIMSVVCVKTVDVAGVPTAQVAWTWRVSNTATNPGGLCVAVDQKLPDYDGDPATRAFAVYLGTRMGYTTDLLTQSNIYRIEAVSVTHAVGVPSSETKLVAVADGSVWTSLDGGDWQQPVGSGTLPNPVFALDVDNPDAFYSMATLNGHLFITDGKTYIDYDGRKDTLSAMRSKTAGDLKKNARRVASVHGCLVWYRFADNPYEFLMSAVGAQYDYDIAPPEQTSTQAVLGTKSPRGTGQARDIINVVFQYDADTSIWGCQSSVWRLDGHPMDNGRFVRLSDSTGLAFGDSICTDDKGRVYGFGTRGVVYQITGTGLEPISDSAIPVRLQSIDFSTTRVAMLWDNQAQGFHLLLTPVDTTAVVKREHYFWSRKFKGWYPQSFQSDDMQPTCIFVGDGDLASNRRAVIGCKDGYARAFDDAASDDDGVAILSHALCGPLTAAEAPISTHFKDMRAVLANNQSGCAFRLFGSDTPDDLGLPVASGTLSPGRSETLPVDAVGCYVALEISNSTRERFSIESIDIDAFAAEIV